MTVTVETLEKLERRLTLTLPAEVIQSEVSKRLRRLARDVKMDGFRPGKVPMSVVAQRYGYSVQHEVVNDKVGEAFSSAAVAAKLRVAGPPKITEKNESPDGQMMFDAVFEVYPEVKIADLSTAEVEKVSAAVTDAAIERTLNILRKQRRTFTQRTQDQAAADSDRVTVDFEGKIDGESFAGGKAEAFQFVIGDGQMLKEFEDAVREMKSGESKTFPLAFPADYHGKDVAGKTADFLVTLNKIEAAHLPQVDGALATSLGLVDGTVAALRADIRKNLEREVRLRLQTRNKQAAMDTLLTKAELDCPRSVVQSELEHLLQSARADLKQRGVKDAENAPIPDHLLRPQAERRVRLGLVMAELVRTHGLQARPEQIKAHIEELAASYEKPVEVVRWYTGDKSRMAEVEAIVIENNVTEFVFSKASVRNKSIGFDELMGQA